MYRQYPLFAFFEDSSCFVPHIHCRDHTRLHTFQISQPGSINTRYTLLILNLDAENITCGLEAGSRILEPFIASGYSSSRSERKKEKNWNLDGHRYSDSFPQCIREAPNISPTQKKRVHVIVNLLVLSISCSLSRRLPPVVYQNAVERGVRLLCILLASSALDCFKKKSPIALVMNIWDVYTVYSSLKLVIQRRQTRIRRPTVYTSQLGLTSNSWWWTREQQAIAQAS